MNKSPTIAQIWSGATMNKSPTHVVVHSHRYGISIYPFYYAGEGDPKSFDILKALKLKLSIDVTPYDDAFEIERLNVSDGVPVVEDSDVPEFLLHMHSDDWEAAEEAWTKMKKEGTS